MNTSISTFKRTICYNGHRVAIEINIANNHMPGGASRKDFDSPDSKTTITSLPLDSSEPATSITIPTGLFLGTEWVKFVSSVRMTT